MTNDKCPKCGGDMSQTEKYTGGGTDWREFTCRSCGHVENENRGKALWQVLSDDREDTEAARALSVGDVVLLTEADPGKGLQAGARGRVLSIDVARGEVEVDFNQPGVKARMPARLVERSAESAGWLNGLRRFLESFRGKSK